MLGKYRIKLGSGTYYYGYCAIDLDNVILKCDSDGKAYGFQLKNNNIAFYALSPDLKGVTSVEELKIRLDMKGLKCS